MQRTCYKYHILSVILFLFSNTNNTIGSDSLKHTLDMKNETCSMLSFSVACKETTNTNSHFDSSRPGANKYALPL